MNHDLVYLKPNVQAEPLIHRWFAWLHLVAPATAARNLSERYLKIMKSYVASPAMHAAAVKNPALRGGPFIELDGGVEQVKELIRQTEETCPEVLAFSQAIGDLHQLLRDKAKGSVLEPLYQEVPEVLRGYVELFYDINQNPSFRFFEPLLYSSPYSMEAAQTMSFSLAEHDGGRPFVNSTPRLPKEGQLDIELPFADPRWDELFKMLRTPRPYSAIRELFGDAVQDEGLFASLFTEEKPTSDRRDIEGLRIRFFGHACVLVETSEVSILVDPCISYTYATDVSRFTYLDLPETIDYVLITHSHQDHILLETLMRLRHCTRNIIVGRNRDGLIEDPSMVLALRSLGFDNVSELMEMDEISLPGGSILGIPFLGEHHDMLIHSKLCYVLRFGERSLMVVADSCNIEPYLYEKVHALVGDVDILFQGMECEGSPASWAYGPLFTQPLDRENDRSRRGRGSNYAEAIQLVDTFKFKEVYIYAMGLEPWLGHILDIALDEDSLSIQESNKMVEECRKRGIVAERMYAQKEIEKPLN
jgi:L-ascorbate metabolism protein UlaG (beta-lactamase superfamily)